MRMVTPILAAIALFLAGCEYEAPLSREHTIPVDPAVLGLWKCIPDKKKAPKLEERMIVLKFSKTEYLIHSPVEKYGIYYRGYPIRLGDIACVQLEVIGDEDGIPKKDDKALFHVVAYRIANGELEVSVLNTALVHKTLKDSDSLGKAFLENHENTALFTEIGRFRRARADR